MKATGLCQGELTGSGEVGEGFATVVFSLGVEGWEGVIEAEGRGEQFGAERSLEKQNKRHVLLKTNNVKRLGQAWKVQLCRAGEAEGRGSVFILKAPEATGWEELLC